MTSPAMASRPVIELAQKSDPGRDPSKQVNEDACAYREVRLGQLLVVCDGMGGHSAGREASNIAVQTILAMVEGAPDGLSPGQVLKSAIEQAGRAVFQLGGAGALMRPGSTVVALLMHSGGTEVGHVGDSRAYCIRGSQIYPLTRDHSMVQQMIDAGFLEPEEAYGHPDANKITRALGLRAETDVDLRPEPLFQEKNDLFLLATDGLFDVVRPTEALDVVLNTRDLREGCDRLVDLANERGGPDNITVMLARVLEAGLRAPSAGSIATQVAEPGSLGALIEAEPSRTTLLQTPATGEAPPPPTLKETLPIGTLNSAYGGATLLDRPSPFPRSSSPTPTQLDPALEEEGKPSHRGGLYLGMGLAAVWVIIFAVSLWWLVGRPKPAPEALPEGVVPTVAPPSFPPPPIPAEPTTQPASKPAHVHQHGGHKPRKAAGDAGGPFIAPPPPETVESSP